MSLSVKGEYVKQKLNQAKAKNLISLLKHEEHSEMQCCAFVLQEEAR